MKKVLLAGASLLAAAATAHAQMAVGTAGLTVTSGTTLYVDGLAVQPSADLTLTSTTLQRTAATAAAQMGVPNIKRLYDLSSPVVFSGTATIYYNDSELNGNVESGLQLAYKTGSLWTTTSGSTANATANTVSKALSGVTFSKLTATSNSTPLPVDLLAFTAQKTAADRQALLRWEVGAEDGPARYEVQRSTDGNAFGAIGAVSASGQASYIFIDAAPAAGHNYYRLRLADASEEARFSPVRLLAFGNDDVAAAPAPLRVTPNPTTGSVTVWVAAGLIGKDAELTDATGRSLLRSKIADASFLLDLTAYPKGLYLLRVANGPVCKLVKQ